MSLLILLLISGCNLNLNSNVVRDVEVDEREKILVFISPERFNDDEYIIYKEVFTGNTYNVKTICTTKDMSLGMFGMKLFPDYEVSNVNLEEFKAIVFVGGMGVHDVQNLDLNELIIKANSMRMLIGAVSEAPIYLVNAGIMEGVDATIHHNEIGILTEAGANYIGQEVVIDDNIFTANNPNAAKDMSEKIIKKLL